jgi:pimeloyl-ACP methyl ester carboxylesterase
MTFVLIHGAASDSWYWHLLVPELEARGHEVVAPDLPCDDDSAGLAEYADAVVEAVGDRTDLVLVAQSLAGFTAPLVCDRLPVKLLIMLAAMTPAPGEAPGDWWANTGYPENEGDLLEKFFHDVPADVRAEAMARGERDQSGTPFVKPWPLAAWPDVPTKFLLCSEDRFFPADYLRQVVKDRLGIVPDELPSGHLPALAHPKLLADRLESYL